MPSPGVVKGAPSFTIQILQDTTQVAFNVQGNYISKNYKLTLQNGFYEQKFHLRPIRSIGEGVSFKGASMAQSPGDGKLPRPLLITITTQQVPSLGKAIKARTLTSWGLVTCCGLTCSGRYMILGDGLNLLGGSGGTVLCNAIPRTPKTVFFALSRSLAPAQKVDGFPGPHFYSALSSRDAKLVSAEEGFNCGH